MRAWHWTRYWLGQALPVWCVPQLRGPISSLELGLRIATASSLGAMIVRFLNDGFSWWWPLPTAVLFSLWLLVLHLGARRVKREHREFEDWLMRVAGVPDVDPWLHDLLNRHLDKKEEGP